MTKIYQALGLTDTQARDIQHFLFPLLVDGEDRDAAHLMLKIAKQYDGIMRAYAMFLFGYTVGEATVNCKLGILTALNPDNLE